MTAHHTGATKDIAARFSWWQRGIIYQVYPRSFQDGDGDGVGDLPGIIRRLDYLCSLHVDALWLSPIYPSPMHDFGYDVADYTGIDRLFGTMSDFDRLLAEAHRRGLKLLLDLVPNHTSDEHPWFLESSSGRDNPKRDWYIWRDPAPDGGPPNNWLSVFGGPAWSIDRKTEQYYFHQFARQQPDLNYRNPEVLQAMLGVMRFWLDRGVDGFRVDAITRLLKDEQFRNEPSDPEWDGVDPYCSLLHIHTKNLPEVQHIVRQMRVVLDEYDDRVMIGEVYLPIQQLMAYYGRDLDGCHLPFNFHLIQQKRWDAGSIRRLVDEYDSSLPRGAWPNWVLGNHDRPRIATRVGQARARVANTLLLTLHGTPICYYGDEIGMQNVPVPPELAKDPPAVNQPNIAHLVGRDPVRTPMQWDGGPNAGFTTEGAVPWLPLGRDYRECNVDLQERDPTSMLSLFRALAALRRAEPALSVGSYRSVDTGDDEVFAFLRSYPAADRFLVVLNLGADPRTVALGQIAPVGTIAVATDMVRSGPVELSSLDLAPNEGLVLRIR